MATSAISINPVDLVADEIRQANALAAQIQAAKSDTGEAIKAILSSSDDKKIAEYRAKKAEAEANIAKINAFLEDLEAAISEHAATLLPTADENFDVEEATKEFLALRKSVTTKTKALASFVPGGEEAVAKMLEEAGVEQIVTLRGKRSSGGVSKPRPRLSAATFNGQKVADKDGKVTFTSLAAHISNETETKVDADFLKGAAFNAAGTQDLSSLPDNTEIKFSVEIGGENHEVTVTTRPKPGPRK